MGLCIGLATVQGYLLRKGVRRDYGFRTEWVPREDRGFVPSLGALLRDTEEYITAERARLKALKVRRQTG